jgi:hypothetical protein
MLGSISNIKQIHINVRQLYDVPSVYTLGNMEEVEEALYIGSMVQQSVKTSRSTDEYKKVSDLKDAEIQRIQISYQHQLAGLQTELGLVASEKERLYGEYMEKVKLATTAERDSCIKEWEEKLRLLRKEHEGLIAKYDTLEVRKRVLEENRDKDIQDAVKKTEALMEKLVAAKQDQLDKLEVSHKRLSDSIMKQTEEIGKLHTTLGKRQANVKQKGNDFEEQFGEKLRRHYGVCQGFKLRQTALNGTGHEMDFVMELESHNIMWELKEYSSVVPKAEVEKFQRDLKENPNSNIGIMVSKTTDIYGKAATGSLLTEFDDNKMLIYVNKFEEFCSEDEGKLFQMLLSLCRIWWQYGKTESGAFDRAEMIRELEKAVEDIGKRRTDWRRHKAHLDELSRWTMDLLDESEGRLDRILKKARNADHSMSGPIVIPEGVFRETADEKDVTWIASIMRVSQAGGEMEVRELVELLSAHHKLSKDTIRSNVMSVIKDSAVIKKGIVKFIKGLSKIVVQTPCLIQLGQSPSNEVVMTT